MGYIDSRGKASALAGERLRALTLVLLLFLAMMLIVPATNAFGAEPASSEPAPAESAAAEPAAAPPAPAPADEEQSASEPAATVTQAPEDISGGNEYTEQAPPTGTGDPAPAPEEPEPTPEPTPSAPATGGAADTAPTAAAETAAATEGLPRTGLDGWPIAVAGIALLGLGIAIRRAATTASV